MTLHCESELWNQSLIYKAKIDSDYVLKNDHGTPIFNWAESSDCEVKGATLAVTHPTFNERRVKVTSFA